MTFRLPKLKEVRAQNEIRLHQLPGPECRYFAEDHPGRVNDRVITLAEATEKLDEQTTWPRDISLRVGAQVMLLMVSPPTSRLVSGVMSTNISEYEGMVAYGPQS